MAADLAIIIVGWNARDWLLRCLASLPAGAAGLDVETWVVDNAWALPRPTIRRPARPTAATSCC